MRNLISSILHRHSYEYERHNSVIVRACACGQFETAIFVEEPEKVATAKTILPKDLKWVKGKIK